MKKIFGFLAVAAFLSFPISADADILGNVELHVSFSNPTGAASFPSISGTYYLDYDVSINKGPVMEAFCVEDADGPGPNISPIYTLITIDTGSTVAKGDLSNAARVAEFWLQNKYPGYESYTDETRKAIAQMAVWEVYFDPVTTAEDIDLTRGNFSTTDLYYQEESDKFAHVALFDPKYNFGTGNWVWAVHPTLEKIGDYQESKPYQNYLVQNPIPEPSTIILFGFGLLGLGIFARRNR